MEWLLRRVYTGNELLYIKEDIDTMRHITQNHEEKSSLIDIVYLGVLTPGIYYSRGSALGPGGATLGESKLEPPDSIHHWPHLPHIFLQFLVKDNNNGKSTRDSRKEA
jgi:hypothetical protein